MAGQIRFTYEFRPPQWRPRAQVNHRTGVLAVATLFWLAVYVTLGARMLARGKPSLGWIEFVLAAVSVVVGILLVLAWHAVVQQWARRLHSGVGPSRNHSSLAKLTPSEFESYVAQQLFALHGYTVVNTPDTRDGGIDIVVVDGSGRRAIVQCKRYKGTVGASTVRDLYGTLMHSGADLGYLVAAGKISTEAREWAAGKPLVLIDGDTLVRLSRSEPEPLQTPNL